MVRRAKVVGATSSEGFQVIVVALMNLLKNATFIFDLFRDIL